MERENETLEPVIELGTASTDTKGPLGDMIETAGLWHKTGIADA